MIWMEMPLERSDPIMMGCFELLQNVKSTLKKSLWMAKTKTSITSSRWWQTLHTSPKRTPEKACSTVLHFIPFYDHKKENNLSLNNTICKSTERIKTVSPTPIRIGGPWDDLHEQKKLGSPNSASPDLGILQDLSSGGNMIRSHFASGLLHTLWKGTPPLQGAKHYPQHGSSLRKLSDTRIHIIRILGEEL